MLLVEIQKQRDFFKTQKTFHNCNKTNTSKNIQKNSVKQVTNLDGRIPQNIVPE